jgi:hypothetical protein
MDEFYMPITIYDTKTTSWFGEQELEDTLSIIKGMVNDKLKRSGDTWNFAESIELKHGKFVSFSYDIKKIQSYPLLLQKEQLKALNVVPLHLYLYVEPSTSISRSKKV